MRLCQEKGRMHHYGRLRALLLQALLLLQVLLAGVAMQPALQDAAFSPRLLTGLRHLLAASCTDSHYIFSGACIEEQAWTQTSHVVTL